MHNTRSGLLNWQLDGARMELLLACCHCCANRPVQILVALLLCLVAHHLCLRPCRRRLRCLLAAQ